MGIQYEALAKKLRKVKDLVIARIEATENDVPEAFEIKGFVPFLSPVGRPCLDPDPDSFPTLFFKPKGPKPQLIEYEDNREVDDLLNFLRKNAEARIPKFKVKKQPQASAGVGWCVAVRKQVG